MEDGGGDVLGNLPRTRPGRRSEKRKPAGTQPRRSRPREAEPPPSQSDPVGAAVRTAAGVAEAGLKVANGITRGLLRQLPRP